MTTTVATPSQHDGSPAEALSGPVLPWEPTPGWFTRAACRGADPATFFPERGQDPAVAKAICAGCPVRAECLDHALGASRTPLGVWGGLCERERRRLRRAHRAAVTVAAPCQAAL